MTMIDPVQVKGTSRDEEDADYAENIIRYNIQHYMNLRGMTHNDLAKVLHVSRGSVSQMLSGYSRLKFRQIFLIARALDVSIDDLLSSKYYLQAEENLRMQMEERMRQMEKKRHDVADVLPRFFVMPETNQLALRAPNSQNGRLAFRAPESRLDEKACIAMLAIAVSRQNLAILVTIPSFGERP